jgi:hypothetical protein
MRRDADAMFLGAMASRVANSMRARYPDLFSLSYDLNEYANIKLLTATAKRNSLQQVVVAAMIPRLLTAFQGAVIVAERGMPAETEVLVRKVIEVIFRIRALERNPSMAERYVKSDDVSRRDTIKRLLELESVERTPEEQQDLQRRHADLAEQVSRERTHAPTTRDYAEQAGLLDYYKTAYTHFSQSAHLNSRDLEAVVQTNQNGDLLSIQYGPSEAGIHATLCTAMEAVVLGLESAFKVLAVDDPVGLRVLSRRISRHLSA